MAKWHLLVPVFGILRNSLSYCLDNLPPPPPEEDHLARFDACGFMAILEGSVSDQIANLARSGDRLGTSRPGNADRLGELGC